jgi:hypothetical protein
MIFIAMMPLDEKRMTVIRKRLAQRDQRARIKILGTSLEQVKKRPVLIARSKPPIIAKTP